MFGTSSPVAGQRGPTWYLLGLATVLSFIAPERVLLISTNCTFLTDMTQDETLGCVVWCSLASSSCVRSWCGCVVPSSACLSIYVIPALSHTSRKQNIRKNAVFCQAGDLKGLRDSTRAWAAPWQPPIPLFCAAMEPQLVQGEMETEVVGGTFS